jgi:mono/diheme cytochrome c family protein
LTEDFVATQSVFLVSRGILLLLLSGDAFARDMLTPPPARADESAQVQRGRYMVQIGGCNDCHTQGYAENSGAVDEKHWLLGSSLGWSGPWGTTYPANLRLLAQNFTESQWLVMARSQWRPPMPWFNLRAMSDEDLGAIYRYIRHMGPAGEPAPAYVPPDRKPMTPVVSFGPSPPPGIQ